MVLHEAAWNFAFFHLIFRCQCIIVKTVKEKEFSVEKEQGEAGIDEK